MKAVPETELLPVAARAYAEPPRKKRGGKVAPKQNALRPSEWTLIFDAETTTDSAQQLRFGAYQVRRAAELHESGLFYDPQALDPTELATLEAYAADHGLAVRTAEEFVEEVFFAYAYELRGTCVGFNLPFDLSRIAVGHGSAKGSMRGGFSFRLSTDKRRPRVRVKHLNNRTSLIDFTARPSSSLHGGCAKVSRRFQLAAGTSWMYAPLLGLCSGAPGPSRGLESICRSSTTSSVQKNTEVP